MAEIKIEKKSPIWPWILIGLILLGLALYFFVFADKSSDKAVADGRDTVATGMTDMAAGGNAITNYIAFVRVDSATMTKNHEYSNEALNKLINATEAMSAKTGVDVKNNLDEAKQLSQNITDNPNATTHADDIKKAASIISSALGTIQQAKFPDLKGDSDMLMNDAKAIDGADLTLDQKGTVKAFYSAAANVLEKMNMNQ